MLKRQINAIDKSDAKMKAVEERRKKAEYEIAKRQKIIEENRRKKSGHITYNDYIVPSSHSTRYFSHSGNTHVVRYKDSYAKRRYDDLNVPISDLKNNSKNNRKNYIFLYS